MKKTIVNLLIISAFLATILILRSIAIKTQVVSGTISPYFEYAMYTIAFTAGTLLIYSLWNTRLRYLGFILGVPVLITPFYHLPFLAIDNIVYVQDAGIYFVTFFVINTIDRDEFF